MSHSDLVVYPSSEDVLHGIWQRLVVRPIEWVSSILSLLFLTGALIVAIPLGLVRAWQKPQHPASAWNSIFRYVIRLYFYVAGIRIEIEGLDHLPANGSPVLLAANHPSHLDGPTMDLAVGARRATAMTAPLNFFPWPYSLWFAKIGAIDIARSPEEEKKYPTAHTGKEAIKLAVWKLTKLKKTILIFPEGHLEKVRHPLPFRTGALRIAIQAGVPIVPVTIRGSERVFSPSRWLLRPGTIRVIFHPPMHVPTNQAALRDHSMIDLLTSQLLCRIASDLPASYYTPGMINACKEILQLHPVTRKAVS